MTYTQHCTLAIILGTATFSISCERKTEKPPLVQAQEFYATRVFVEQPQAGYQVIPKGLVSLSAQTCGACHEDIYNEWKVSTHAQAWTDRQFREETKKSDNKWLCNGCHTPLLNQMESWVVALENNDVEKPRRVKNANFDKAFQNEGITCAACHVRDGFVEGPFGNTKAPHATRKASRFSSHKLCTNCHQAVQHYPGKTFVCTFETGKEWENGPYPAEEKICQSCHMPEVNRPLMTGFPVRKGRKHYWPGAGVYKRPGFGPPLSELPPGLDLQARQNARVLEVTLFNKNAGHKIPTGDPERVIIVDIVFTGTLPTPVHAQLRIGQQWKWWPKPEKLSDNRLAPREKRLESFPIPEGAQHWTVKATSRRISDDALRHHRLTDYPAFRVTHELQGEISTDQSKSHAH